MPCPTDPAPGHFLATAPAPTTRTQHVAADAHDQALDRLFTRLAKAIVLPQVIQRIMTVAAKPRSCPRDMRDAIQSDPVMGAHILRRINSSQFGMTNKIADLTTAIGLLGIPEIRNIGMTIFVARMFDQPGNFRGYSREQLWRHCCGVAFAARKIARVTGSVSPDEGFIAGLLHHTGTIVLDQQLRSHFCQVIDKLTGANPTFVVERAVYSFDQSQLSAFIAQQWQLPKTITDAIGYYQYPTRYDGPHQQHVSLLAVANYLCHRAGWTSVGVRNATAPPDIAYAALGMTKVELAILWEELKSSLHESILDS